MTNNEIIAMLRAGKTGDEIAAEMSKALNAATATYEAEKKAEEAKRKAEAEKKAKEVAAVHTKMAQATKVYNALRDYYVAVYPSVKIEMAGDEKTIKNFAGILDSFIDVNSAIKDLKASTKYYTNLNHILDNILKDFGF